jgi:hypothetical protein
MRGCCDRVLLLGVMVNDCCSVLVIGGCLLLARTLTECHPNTRACCHLEAVHTKQLQEIVRQHK